MFEEFLFFRELTAVVDRKRLEIRHQSFPKFRAGQHYTRLDSAGESLSAFALAQEFGLTSFFFESYIPQSLPRNEHSTFR